jgi:hypothetical protein
MACGERGLGVCLYSPAGDVEGGANRAVAFDRRNRLTRSAGSRRDTGWDNAAGEVMISAEAYRTWTRLPRAERAWDRCRRTRDVGDDPHMLGPRDRDERRDDVGW